MSVGNLFRIFLCKRFSGRRKCSGGKNVRSDSFGPFSSTFIFAHFCRQNARLHNDLPPFTTYYLIMFFLQLLLSMALLGSSLLFFLLCQSIFHSAQAQAEKASSSEKTPLEGLDKEKIVRKGSEKRQIRGKLFESNFATKLFKS